MAAFLPESDRRSFHTKVDNFVYQTGRLQIPAEFVRMWALNNHNKCLMRVGGMKFPMDMKVGFEAAPGSPSDRVIVKGDFWSGKLDPDRWLVFTLVQDPPTHELMDGCNVIFDVKML